MVSPDQANRYNIGDFPSGIYTPFICNISAITQASNAVVTTSIDHAFVIGNQVQFYIPPQWGMQQLNGVVANVNAIPSVTQIQIDTNTSSFDAFVTPSLPNIYVVIDSAQVSAIGDSNFGTLSPGGIPTQPSTIPGAFQNLTS